MQRTSYYKFIENIHTITLWEKFKLFFCKVRVSLDYGEKCKDETVVSYFKVMNGKIYVLGEKRNHAKNED